MPSKEAQTLNAVLKNKDVGVLFGESVDELFVGYKDVWEETKKYYHKYHSIPDVEIISERFPDFEILDVTGDTVYYLEGLKNEFLDVRIERILTGMARDKTPDNAAYILAKGQEALARLNRFTATSRDLNIMDMDEAERHFEEVRERAAAMGGVPGIKTGVDFIDAAYPSGFAPGDLIIVFGWTGRAKSLFTTLVSCNAHDAGYKPMITSLEMSGEKVRDRVLTIKGSGLFRNSELALGDVNVDNFRQFKEKQKGAEDFIVVTNDGIDELTPNVMQAKIDQHHPSMLTFDYAQLGSDNENSTDMTARMRNMSKQYKRLAVANKMPVVLISSATPDSTASASEPPRIEQVAWSKQLAFDADLAFGVHKYDDSNTVEIACRKNRNGPLFNGFLDWDIDRGIIKETFLQ